MSPLLLASDPHGVPSRSSRIQNRLRIRTDDERVPRRVRKVGLDCSLLIHVIDASVRGVWNRFPFKGPEEVVANEEVGEEVRLCEREEEGQSESGEGSHSE